MGRPPNTSTLKRREWIAEREHADRQEALERGLRIGAAREKYNVAKSAGEQAERRFMEAISAMPAVFERWVQWQEAKRGYEEAANVLMEALGP